MMTWLLLLPMLLFPSNRHLDLYEDIPDSDQPTPHFITSLLDQPFTYLGEGAQVYVFESEDQKTVLKLFKAQHKKKLTPARFFRHLKKTDASWKVSEEKWHQKFAQTCNRYETAFTHLKEETGLIYLHFAKTKEALPITLIHKYIHKINLAKLPFILQKKAELVPIYFKNHPEKRATGEQALKELFIHRTKKGFSDPRQSLSINYGFIGDQAIQIDVGKIEPFSGNIDEEIEKIHAHIDEWLSRM